MFDDNPILEFRGPWGVPVQIGGSILLFPLIYIPFSGDALSMLYGGVFMLVIVGSIYLHELGHAWGALIQGVPVRRVMIYGGGGFCERARSASAREDEFIVAMGPIVNLALWAVAGLLTPLVSDPDIVWLLATVSWVNLMLVILNMMPVMPLDGGRLFHLGLLRVFPARIALRIAGGVGLIVAILWIPAMIFSYFSMGFVIFLLPSVLLHWQMLSRRSV